MRTRTKLLVGLCIAAAGFLCWGREIVIADTLISPNYRFQETGLGGLGNSGSQSANYQVAQQSGGILGFGNSSNTFIQANNGHSTTADPALSFGIVSPSVNFGTFSAGAATVATSAFEVLDYTSYGYIVQIIGNPPSRGSHTITAMSSAAPSQAGIEQFGINLVANTSPVSLGANPNHGQFGFGSGTTNYATANNYRYVSGDTIASAPKSSGLTIYTISYIINVSSLTPGGQYSGGQTIICTATY